jgi:phage tail-like protein
MSNEEKESTYIQYLPSIYQTTKEDTSSAFLGIFLKAFEKVLTGIDDGVCIDFDPAKDIVVPALVPPCREGSVRKDYDPVQGIVEVLDNFYNYFDPQETPEGFLNWLASWVALTLKEGETWEDKKRQLISRIVPLYQKRGTREGLEEYLKIYVGEGVSVYDDLGPLRVGVNSSVGIDTVIGGLVPYFFIVEVTFPAPNPKIIEEKTRAIKEIIEIEKPAHTFYRININMTTLRVGYSRVELDTQL